ncbi:MAG: ABC transporter permease subunit [Vicinamibacterales bacterium]
MRTAFAKGLSERRVIFVHALRNSLIPLVTGLGNAISLLLAGSFLIERVFNIDGMGYLGYTAILQRDYPVALGILVIGSLLMLVGNVLVRHHLRPGRPAHPLSMIRAESILAKHLHKLRRLKRSYYSFLIVAATYLISFALPLIANNKALVVPVQTAVLLPCHHLPCGESARPPGNRRSRLSRAETDVRRRGQGKLGADAAGAVGPDEALLDDSGTPPNPPSRSHLMGTDNGGRGHARATRRPTTTSMTFAIVVTLFGEGLGIAIGAMLGYFGGKLDILGQRGIDLVVAPVPLHNHHHQLGGRAGLPAGALPAGAAVVLAARRDPLGIQLDGDHLLRARRVLCARR